MIRSTLKLAVNTARLHRDPARYFRDQGVEIGQDVDIYGANVFTFGSEPYLVSIGNRVTISHGVDFITHDGGLRVARAKFPNAYLYRRIQVADQCFLGAHCILLPGAMIGMGSVIGAGAIVTGEIPAGVVAVGMPAKPIKTVEEYVQGNRHLWIDTEGLSHRAKKDLLLRRLPSSL